MGSRDARHIPSLRAIHDPDGAEDTEALPAEAALSTRDEELKALRRAGWRVVDAEVARRKGTPPEKTAQVYVAGDRHVLLCNGTLNVKFHDDVSRDTVHSRLEQAGFGIQQRIPVGENTFRVEPLTPNDCDAREAARALESLDEVEFAEPEFIEYFRHR